MTTRNRTRFLPVPFHTGDRVQYFGAKQQFQGRMATVVRQIKSRGVVHVVFDGAEPANQRQFDAYPQGLQRWLSSEPATEPTDQGLQYVMPGCEKDRSRGSKQADLF